MIFKHREVPQTSDLRDVYKIEYKNRTKAPIQFSVSEDSVLITAYIAPAKSLLKPYIGRGKGRKPEDFTFADEAFRGIMRNWSGDFDLKCHKGGPVRLSIDIIRKDDPNAVYPKGQRFLKIRRTKLTKTSFVMSPPWRWLWGMPRSGLMLESFGLNWSVYSPGTINLNLTRSVNRYGQVAAHEFGHALGLGDAYGAFYRFGYDVPGTEEYMMNNNHRVQPVELEMALTAHMTGRMQYFPRRGPKKAGAKDRDART